MALPFQTNANLPNANLPNANQPNDHQPKMTFSHLIFSKGSALGVSNLVRCYKTSYVRNLGMFVVS
jgi:hypothetical protein